MTDSISREEAIEAALEYQVEYCGAAFDIKMQEGMIKKLKDIPSAEPQWIPVSEGLPEDGERVLATHLGGLNPNRQVIEHVYANGEFTMGWDMDMNMDSPTFGQRYMGKVIAWKPLPKPYEGDIE